MIIVHETAPSLPAQQVVTFMPKLYIYIYIFLFFKIQGLGGNNNGRLDKADESLSRIG